ncbi:Cardiolipin synthetase, partial [hydrothermal vent metagenome]
FIGGFNIHDESSEKHYGKNRWKDSHICFNGDLVRQLGVQFDLMWGGKIRQLSTINSLDSLTHIVPNATRTCRKHLRCEYLKVINQANQSIKVTTPYFVPDSKMLKALVQAAKSGISITLLIPKHNNHALLKYAAYWYYQKLISSGINIYEFTSRMLHTKNMLIDDEVAVIGSANMDYRSFFLNNEIMLFSKRPELVKYVNQDFADSLKHSSIVSLQEATTRSPVSLFSTFIAYLLRRWL